MDLFFDAFWLEGGPEDNGFMLRKHSKYVCVRKVYLFIKSMSFFTLGWLWGVILGGFGYLGVHVVIF